MGSCGHSKFQINYENQNTINPIEDKKENERIENNISFENNNSIDDIENNESKNKLINENDEIINTNNENNININCENDINNKGSKRLIEDYIVCLRCKCRSPHIEKINFDYNLKDINVSYYCACFFEHNRPQSESLELLINSTKPLNLCPIHSMNTLKFYCNICKKFFCEKCERDSEEHNKDFVNFDIIMSEDNAEKIKKLSIKTQNEVLYKNLINDYLNNLKKIEVPKYHLKSTKNLHDKVTAIILLQSGLIAAGSYDKTIFIWDIEKLSCDKKIKVLEKVLSLLEFKPNMILSSHESTICLWDINSDKEECFYKFNGDELWVNCLVKYDDKFFVSASNDHKIIIWDYEQRKRFRKFRVHRGCILALIKLNDGNLCSGGGDDFVIRIFDWEKEKLISKLKGHTNMVKCLCQMDNETILSGSDDRTIKIWKKYKCILTIEGHSHLVNAILKLNDNYFASGSFDNSIIIWNIKTFLSRQKLTDSSSKILYLLKLNNNELISCSDDNKIKIWG